MAALVFLHGKPMNRRPAGYSPQIHKESKQFRNWTTEQNNWLSCCNCEKIQEVSVWNSSVPMPSEMFSHQLLHSWKVFLRALFCLVTLPALQVTQICHASMHLIFPLYLFCFCLLYLIFSASRTSLFKQNNSLPCQRGQKYWVFGNCYISPLIVTQDWFPYRSGMDEYSLVKGAVDIFSATAWFRKKSGPPVLLILL